MKSILITFFLLNLAQMMDNTVSAKTIEKDGNTYIVDSGSNVFEATKKWKFKFELVEASKDIELQDYVDQTYEKIFSTKAASQFCAVLDPGNKNIIKAITGVGSSSARRIDKICRTSSKIKNLMTETDRHTIVYFVFTNVENFPLQGWSNDLAHTFLFFKDRKSITDYDLTKSLSHELSIKLDLRSLFTKQFAYYDFDNSWWLSKESKTVYTPTDRCRAFSIFLSPIFQSHFMSERARNFEFKVIKERLNSDIKDNYDQLSCSDRVLYSIGQLAAINNSFNVDGATSVYEQKLKEYNCRVESDGERLLNDFIFLKSEKIIFKNKNINLCDYLSDPWVQVLPVFMNSGPGPRIGGGWKTSDSGEISNLVEKTHQLLNQDDDGAKDHNQLEELKKDLLNKFENIMQTKIENYK